LNAAVDTTLRVANLRGKRKSRARAWCADRRLQGWGINVARALKKHSGSRCYANAWPAGARARAS